MNLNVPDSGAFSTPGELGFSLPVRSDRHACTLMSWPPKEEVVGTNDIVKEAGTYSYSNLDKFQNGRLNITDDLSGIYPDHLKGTGDG